MLIISIFTMLNDLNNCIMNYDIDFFLKVLSELNFGDTTNIKFDIEHKDNGDIVLHAPKQNSKEEQKEVNDFYDSLGELDDDIFKSAVKKMRVEFKDSFDLLADKDPKRVNMQQFRKAVEDFKNAMREAADVRIVEIEDEIDALYEEINTLKATYMK